MMRSRLLLTFSLLTLLLPATAFAQSLASDRPTAAVTPKTVPAMKLQIETGLAAGRETAGDKQTAYALPTRLRFGLTDWLELDLAGSPYSIVEVDGTEDTLHGVPPIVPGVRVQFNKKPDSPVVPVVGVLVTASIPLEDELLAQDSVVLGPTLAASWSFTKHLSATLNGGATMPVENFDATAITYAGAVSRDLSPLTEKLKLFVELYGVSPLTDAETRLLTDFGFQYLITKDFQIDGAFAVGLTDVAQDIGGTLGLAVRL